MTLDRGGLVDFKHRDDRPIARPFDHHTALLNHWEHVPAKVA
jgi:hypothetical protein